MCRRKRERGTCIAASADTAVKIEFGTTVSELMVYHILADESPFVESRRSVSRR